MNNEMQLKELRKTFENVRLLEYWDHRYYYHEALGVYRAIFDFVIESLNIRPGSLGLDAGCGLGRHAMEFARRGIRCHAIDFSEAVINEARKRVEVARLNGLIEFTTADLTCLSFADGSFDFVLCWGVLMHVPDISTALTELARVLKPGGRIALSLSNPDSAELKAYRMLPRLNNDPDWSWGPMYVRGFAANELTRMLKQRNLRILKVRPGQFTEYRAETGLGRKGVSFFNMVWFKVVRTPHLAAGYVVIAEKT